MKAPTARELSRGWQPTSRLAHLFAGPGTLDGSSASVSSAPSVDGRPQRWVALDLLRFVAVLLMVQGHTFSALLDPAIKTQPWFLQHDYVHGLTAPLFFFGSGLAFGLATLPNWDAHRRWGVPLKRRYQRYGWLLFIGYMLNLPRLSFPHLLRTDSAELTASFFRVDALQHIGVALGLVQTLVWASRGKRSFAWGVGLLGAAFVLGAPLAWRLPAERWLPVGIASYINADTGATFPLFPWMGFVCAGVLSAHLISEPKTQRRRSHAGLRFWIAGAAIWLVAGFARDSGVNAFGEHNYWKTSPIFFATRLGLVLMSFALLCAYEAAAARRRAMTADRTAALPQSPEPRGERPGAATAPLQTIGRQTLVIYVVHLILLYGSPFHAGLNRDHGASLGLLPASLVAAALLFISTLFGLFWDEASRRWPQQQRYFRKGLAAFVFVFALLHNPNRPDDSRPRSAHDFGSLPKQTQSAAATAGGLGHPHLCGPPD